MEVRVRERLVGALVLVAIVVLLVPAILTGRGSAPSEPPAQPTRRQELPVGDAMPEQEEQVLVPEPLADEPEAGTPAEAVVPASPGGEPQPAAARPASRAPDPPPPETVFFFPGPEGDVDGDGDIDADDENYFSFSCAASGNCLGATPCQGLRCTIDGEVRFPVRTFWTQDFE